MAELEADCSRCTGLCCMAFQFERSEDFAIDKPAGAPCPHLAADFGCAIHARREDMGFPGCIRFDCQGAGQRLTEEVFPGVDWRDAPGIRPRVIEAFRALREVHRLLELVLLAGRLPLSLAQLAEREELLALLDPADGWTETSLRAFPDGPLPKRTADYLASLRDTAAARRASA